MTFETSIKLIDALVARRKSSKFLGSYTWPVAMRVTRNGEQQGVLALAQAEVCTDASCQRCRSDLEFLKETRRPEDQSDHSRIRAVDLFAGCGGMSLGLAEAVRRLDRRLDIPLAVDIDNEVVEIFKANLPNAACKVADVATLFDGQIGTDLTDAEQATKEIVGTGEVDILLGGPPCQGHSNLNNHTRGRDPKNAFYLRMARAAEVLAPKVVVVENVAPVQRDEDRVVETTSEALIRAGYQVYGRVVDLRRVGVPQRRRRYLLLASRLHEIRPAATLEDVATGMPDHPDRTVHWAISDLLSVGLDGRYDTASQQSEDNRRRIAYLFDRGLYDLPNERRPDCHRDKKHTYVSMYGRLRWEEPAQTITTGFGSMGQGRYVHPQHRRTITPHEAARLQTFPDWFDFGKKSQRGVLAKMIGNAVPPLLMVALGLGIVPRLGSATAKPGRPDEPAQ
ncbi:MAG TPA: DNA cytosine methyltransferase [Thermoanaerobaculia bacterium]